MGFTPWLGSTSTNFRHNNFTKLHRSHMTLDQSEILVKREQLCLLPSLKISAHFNFIKWEILLLLWSHLKLGPEHKMTYNLLQATPKSLRFERHIRDMSSIICLKFQLYWWWPQRIITLKRKWLQNWNWNFKCLDLSQYRSKWHEISFTYIFHCDLYDPKAADPKKFKQKRYDQKTRSGTEFSKVHNSHKTYLFLLKIWE